MFVSFESAKPSHSSGMAKKAQKIAKSKPAPGTEAERCVRLRVALGYPTANAFAKFLDIGQQRWSNYENGFPLSRDIIFKLVQSIPGLSSDWLYFGNPDGLSVDLARRLGELGPPGNRKTA